MKPPCSIADCDKPSYRRGWCNAHYLRWRRHGDPLAGRTRRYKDAAEAFQAKTEWRGDCLVWTGRLYNTGYGRITYQESEWLAHRYAWTVAHGPIPPGIEIDHACWNRACVNVAHLRAATKAENMRNRNGAQATNRSTGVRNVTPNPGGKGFSVRIKRHGVRYNFGTFPTVELAAEAAARGRAKLFGEFAGR